MILRFRYRQLGGHVHVRLFTAVAVGTTFELCGELVFRFFEWPELVNRFASVEGVEFINDDPDGPARTIVSAP